MSCAGIPRRTACQFAGGYFTVRTESAWLGSARLAGPGTGEAARRFTIGDGSQAEPRARSAVRRAFGTLGIRQLACTEQAVLEHEHWSVKVAALQTAHKNALTCTAIAEGGCFGTHSALAVLDGFASSLGYSHTTRVFGASQCLSASR